MSAVVIQTFPSNMNQTDNPENMKRELGLLDATLLVAGGMIGSGIFIVSADVTRNVGSAGWLLIIWLITGFMTLAAALSYGELSGMYPKAGGQYVYLREAYNPLIAFLFGWSFFAVIQTGTIAAVGVAFSKFFAYFIPALGDDVILFTLIGFKISSAQLVSIALIVLLTYINTRGVKSGKIIQTTFTSAKLISLIGLILFGLVLMKPEVWAANWTNAFQIQRFSSSGVFEAYPSFSVLAGGIAAAMVGTLFSSDSWNNVTFVAGEITNPKRNIGLALLFGTLTVTIIYVLTNIMYTAVLPMNDIATAAKDRVGIAAAESIFGASGTAILALLVMVSTFGCNNGLILSGARVYYSMAQDGLFFKKAGELNKNAVPEFGLWIQCALASVLCLSGRYGDLLDMICFVVVIFYVLTILGIFILRAKQPNLERPYRAIGYPVLPAIYILMGISFCVLLIIYKPAYTWPGLIIVALGVPIYYLLMRKK